MNKDVIKALHSMNLMTANELVEKMGNAVCVTLTFYKMDGTLRVMRATRNFKFAEENSLVTNYKKPYGIGLSYNNKAYGLVTVFDLENAAFRQVPANRMLSVVVG